MDWCNSGAAQFYLRHRQQLSGRVVSSVQRWPRFEGFRRQRDTCADHTRVFTPECWPDQAQIGRTQARLSGCDPHRPDASDHK